MKISSLFLLVICTMLATMSISANTPLLKPCPARPNCVSSQATEQAQYVEPFTFSDAPALAWQRLVTVIEQTQRTVLVTQAEDYLHAKVSSLIFRFVDDIEFVLQADQQLIQVRSASRTGYSDFGVNRKRIEALRLAFEKSAAVTQDISHE